MIFPTFKRIYKTDYPADQQPLVDKLSVTINNGFEVIYNAFSKNISLKENILCSIRNITVTVDSNGIPTQSSGSSFNIDTTGQILGTEVIKSVNNTNSSVFPTGQPFLTYSQNNNIVTIVHVAGIPANNSFTLTLIAWA